MKEFKEIGDGTTGAARWEKVWAQIISFVIFTLFPWFLTICVTLIAFSVLLGILLGKAGAVILIAIGLYGFLILGRYGVEHLKSRPDYPMFQKHQWTYSAVLMASTIMKHLFFLHNALINEARRLYPIVKSKGVQFVVWSGKQYWGLKPQWKIGIPSVIIVLLFGVSYFVTIGTYNIVAKNLPYGKARYEMTQQQLQERKKRRIETAKFAVWGKEDAVKNAESMLKYRPLIEEAAAKYKINPNRMEGQLFVESAADPNAMSGKGARGLAQIMLDVACVEKLITDTKFCDQVKSQRLRKIPANVKVEDGRLDPAKAFMTAAKILGDSRDYWGGEEWAFVEYHMGRGNLRLLCVAWLDDTHPGWDKTFPIDRTLVKIGKDSKGNDITVPRYQLSDLTRSVPKGLAEFNITYDDIFFRHTPDRTPKTSAQMRRMNSDGYDSTPTYVYTGIGSTEGFAQLRTDKPGFLAMVADQQDPDGGYANRIKRAWYSDKDAKYKTLADIQAAIKSGELVPVPNDPKWGFVLRTTGPSRIGQCDAGNEEQYYYTKKATLGAMYLMGSRTREYGAKPVEVTGLIRSKQMYTSGCLPATEPKVHVIGLAFDVGSNIGGGPMPAETRKSFLFVVQDMAADGLIARSAEGSADHFDINSDPQVIAMLEAIVDEVNAGNSPLVP